MLRLDRDAIVVADVRQPLKVQPQTSLVTTHPSHSDQQVSPQLRPTLAPPTPVGSLAYIQEVVERLEAKRVCTQHPEDIVVEWHQQDSLVAHSQVAMIPYPKADRMHYRQMPQPSCRERLMSPVRRSLRKTNQALVHGACPSRMHPTSPREFTRISTTINTNALYAPARS